MTTDLLTRLTIEHDRLDAIAGRSAPAPEQWCASCLYPLSSHADGLCEDGTFSHFGPGPAQGTYRYLPLGLDRPDLVRDVADSYGDRAFVFWISDTFDPPLWFARGESFQDAYDWFVEAMVERGTLTDSHDELVADAARARVRGETDDSTRYVDSEGAEIPSGYDYVDGHDGIFYTENIGGREIRRP